MRNDRLAGVKIPEGQSGVEYGEPKQVRQVVEIKLVAVEYADSTGQVKRNTFVKAGDQYLHHPDFEEWTRQLREVAPWLLKGLKERLDAETAPLPAQDNVDVVVPNEASSPPA